jgi:nucleoside-diphosphate-sugar epimerase
MKIFLTGSSGFVGTNLLSYLRTAKIDIDCLNRDELKGINLLQFDKNSTIVHLAAKAHDLNKVLIPKDYYNVNYELTRQLYDFFLRSNASKFIFISSVKAAADTLLHPLTEKHLPCPKTHYGKSKLMAEEYIRKQPLPKGKSYYILRPCMIYGPGNKGNLNQLYNLVSKEFPWPLGNFENYRSYLAIENLCFVLRELIEREDIISGIYNLADDDPLSTNEVINLIAESRGKKPNILNLSKNLIKVLALLGDLFKLPLNSERLYKLTESYVVSNAKIKEALGMQLPVKSKDGLMLAFKSFADNA